MLAQIIALLAAAAPAPAQPATAQPPPTTVSPLIVPSPGKPPAPDATVDVAGSDDIPAADFVAVWPATAYHAGADGHVMLSCRIDIHGLAEWCQVSSETPAGKGFGKAALELRPTFKLKPATGPDGQPVNSTMSIKVGFKAPDFQFDRSHLTWTGNPLAMRDVTMVDDPVWSQAATFDDLAHVYPAKGEGAEGYAAVHCAVLRSGALNNCGIIKEEPKSHDFGKAALTLTSRFRLDPRVLARAPHRSPLWVDVPVRFPPPAEIAERTVMAPAWLLGVDPRATPSVFPPEAAAQGLTTGRGIARCTIAADGTMAACVPEPGEPDGLGFSEAAAKLAAKMRMNLWSADGAPVEGGVVHIPIRLNLKSAS